MYLRIKGEVSRSMLSIIRAQTGETYARTYEQTGATERITIRINNDYRKHYESVNLRRDYKLLKPWIGELFKSQPFEWKKS